MNWFFCQVNTMYNAQLGKDNSLHNNFIINCNKKILKLHCWSLNYELSSIKCKLPGRGTMPKYFTDNCFMAGTGVSVFHSIFLYRHHHLWALSSSRMHQNGLHNQIRSKENSTFLLPRFLWRATYWVISDPKTRSWTHIFLCNPFCIFGKYWAGESRKSPDNWSGALGGWASVREASYLTSRPTKDLWTTLNTYDNCDDDTFNLIYDQSLPLFNQILIDGQWTWTIHCHWIGSRFVLFLKYYIYC